MLGFLQSAIGFMIILGPLVVVHEFGHYIFARIFGVKAEIFSVGFGPKLWSKQLGETELRLSAIPLGGYVKLLGEDRDSELPEKELRRALHRQAAWKRFFIFFGGPLFNFLFAIVVLMAILVIGEPQVSNVIGRVVKGSAAEQAGFRSGDRIVGVDGKPVKRFEEVALALNESPDRVMQFEVVHLGQDKPVTLEVKPSSESGYSVYGESTQVGEIDGLMIAPRASVAGVSNSASAAAKAGIKTGDQITEVSGKPVMSWEELELAYAQAPSGSEVKLKIQNIKSKETRDATLRKTDASKPMFEAWGLHSSELFVRETVAKSPAQQAGVQTGDRLVAVGSRQVQSFFELRDAVQKEGEKTGKINLTWERDGKRMTAIITPTATKTKDAVLKEMTNYTVGVMPMLAMAEPEMVVERVWNPFKLVYKGTEKMLVLTWRNVVSLRKMITGDVSVNTLGGPIMIARIAGESLARGITTFLTNMAIFSVGLGILNVLPIPVLDGGHLLLLAIETVRGRPLNIRTMEIIQLVGLCLILMLMGLAFKNDFVRLQSF